MRYCHEFGGRSRTRPGSQPRSTEIAADPVFQYLRARYYDPGSGNFLTRDPIDTITRDPYNYANNNPLNLTDPSGLYWGESFVEGVKGVAEVAVEVTSTAVNTVTGVNAVGLGYGAVTSGGNCYFREWKIECDGVAAPRPLTIGNIVLNPDSERLSDDLFAHEAIHTYQWGLFGGPPFVFAYSADWLQLRRGTRCGAGRKPASPGP